MTDSGPGSDSWRSGAVGSDRAGSERTGAGRAGPSNPGSLVADALREVVRTRQTDELANPRLVRALLSDLLGSDARSARAEIDAVVLAAETNIASTTNGPPTDAAATDTLTDLGLSGDMARFAIESWQWATTTDGATAQGSTLPPSSPISVQHADGRDTPTSSHRSGSEPSAAEHDPADHGTSTAAATASSATVLADRGSSRGPSDDDAGVRSGSEGDDRRSRTLLSAVAVIVAIGLVGAVAAFIGFRSNGSGTAADHAGPSTTADSTMQERNATPGPDRAAVPDPEAPTAAELADADVAGTWRIAETIAGCAGFTGCDATTGAPPLADLGLYWNLDIVCADSACTATIEDQAGIRNGETGNLDGADVRTADLVAPWDIGECQGADGSSWFVSSARVALEVRPAAATRTEDGWHATLLRGSGTITPVTEDADAAGACAGSTVTYDFGAVLEDESLPDVAFERVTALVGQKLDDVEAQLAAGNDVGCALTEIDAGLSGSSPRPQSAIGAVFPQHQSRTYAGGSAPAGSLNHRGASRRSVRSERARRSR